MDLLIDTIQVEPLSVFEQNVLNALSIYNIEMGKMVSVQASKIDLEDIQLSLKGNEQAFARLIKRYEKSIAAQMWRFTRDPVILDELVQDVFIEVFNSLKRFKGHSSFYFWIRRISLRVGYRYWKRKGREQSRFVDPDEIELEALKAPEKSQPSEAAEMLYTLLKTLPVKERMVLTLHYFDGCDMNEVAERMGWSRALVKVSAYRARQKLRAKLIQAGFGDDHEPRSTQSG